MEFRYLMTRRCILDIIENAVDRGAPRKKNSNEAQVSATRLMRAENDEKHPLGFTRHILLAKKLA